MQTKDVMKEKLAMEVSLLTIVVNLLLAAGKLAAGVIGSSGAMISDAIHSASDVFSTLIVIVGVKLAGRQSDEEHPYGHERFECVASIVLAVILAATGLLIGWRGVQKIVMSGNGIAIEIPGKLALLAAIISIAVKEGMFWYTRAAARQIQSGAMMANAWHHRSDALSSVGSFIGIFGAQLGYPILDPAASVVICCLILKAAYDIFRDAIDKMTDKSCDEEIIEKIQEIAEREAGVICVDLIKTRMFGNKIYVDVEIGADGNSTLEESHKIAEQLHDDIEKRIEGVKHCMVHVNPYRVTIKQERLAR